MTGDFISEVAEYINSFSFKIGETWLSTWWTPALWVPFYFLTLGVLKKYVAYRKQPFSLKGMVVFHNFFLSIGSGLLLALLSYDLVHLYQTHGFAKLYCNESGELAKGRHVFYYYINYIFKFIELFDTVLLALRAKPMIFLHVYHHAATLVLCWLQLRAETCVQWIPITLNLAVHVLMYYYYAASALGKEVWWKKYLTMGQIVQFVVGLLTITPALILRFLSDFGGFPFIPKCYGNYEAGVYGIGILASYLVLFLGFFDKTYKKPSSSSSSSSSKVDDVNKGAKRSHQGVKSAEKDVTSKKEKDASPSSSVSVGTKRRRVAGK